jgi:hypothetical protein
MAVLTLAAGLAAGWAAAAWADAMDPNGGQVTFRMDRVDSVRDFYTRYFGQVPPYRERGEEDWQDSIARCLFAYGKFKAKRFETVILYAGREPDHEENLICNIFPIDEPAYHRLCAGIGMAFISADEGRYELTCGPKPENVGLKN